MGSFGPGFVSGPFDLVDRWVTSPILRPARTPAMGGEIRRDGERVGWVVSPIFRRGPSGPYTHGIADYTDPVPKHSGGQTRRSRGQALALLNGRQKAWHSSRT